MYIFFPLSLCIDGGREGERERDRERHRETWRDIERHGETWRERDRWMDGYGWREGERERGREGGRERYMRKLMPVPDPCCDHGQFNTGSFGFQVKKHGAGYCDKAIHNLFGTTCKLCKLSPDLYENQDRQTWVWKQTIRDHGKGCNDFSSAVFLSISFTGSIVTPVF